MKFFDGHDYYLEAADLVNSVAVCRRFGRRIGRSLLLGLSLVPKVAVIVLAVPIGHCHLLGDAVRHWRPARNVWQVRQSAGRSQIFCFIFTIGKASVTCARSTLIGK